MVVADVDRQKGQKAVDESNGEGGTAWYQYVDLSSAGSIEAMGRAEPERLLSEDILSNSPALGEVGPVIATHTGPGVVGVAFYAE